MSRICLLFAIALLLLPLLSFAQTTVPIADSLYNVALAAYEDGDFNAAELAALRGLRETEGDDELERIRFHALLGYVYVARDQNDVARTEFLKVLSINPGFAPDPLTTSPKILEVFRQSRAEYLLRVASEPAIYRMPPADVRIAASWRSLVVPGLGQFYKQQEVKGGMLMAAQVLSLAALIFMQTEVNRRHDDYLRITEHNHPDIEDRFQEYRRAYQIRNAVGYITLGIYITNYLDALYYPVRKQANKLTN